MQTTESEWDNQLTRMKIVLTNDDGIHAPGLEALYRVALEWGEPIVVAPEECHSSMSHCVTTTRPLTVTEIRPGWYQVDGTPADCTRLALMSLVPQAEYLIAGINQGGNLGADVFLSGTVAAAREAAFLGKPAIAISHYVARGRKVDWDLAAQRARAALEEVLRREPEPHTLWNINLPHPPEGSQEPTVVFCPTDTYPLPVQFQKQGSQYLYCGDYHARQRKPGSDVAECFGGNITASKISMGVGNGREGY